MRYSGSEIRVIHDNNELVMTNEGNVTVIISEGQGAFLDNDLSVISSNGRVLLRPSGDSYRLMIPNNAIAFMLTEGNNNSIIEL